MKNILPTLRNLKSKVLQLEKDQIKKVDKGKKEVRVSSGSFNYTEKTASEDIDFVLRDVEEIYMEIIRLQNSVINTYNDI